MQIKRYTSEFNFCLILAFCFLLNSACLSQNTNGFSGKIIDKVTGSPISYAHVLLKNTLTGITSSIEGDFLIKLPINSSNVSLVISCVGYKTRILEINTNLDYSRIELEPEIKVLNEVIISPINARDLVIRASNSISLNYPTHPTILNGFYRESLKYNDSSYIYIAEGVLEARKEDYTRKQSYGQVKLIKSRKKEFIDTTQKGLRFYAGPHIIHRFDFVGNRLEFIDVNELDNYSFNIEMNTYLEGKEVIAISFIPINIKAYFEGVIMLEAVSNAFIGAKYHLTKAGLKHYENNVFSTDFLKRDYLVNYMKVGNKWFIQNIWQKGELYDKWRKDTIIYTTEFVTTKTDTSRALAIPYGHRLLYGDFFVDKVDKFDPDFWKDYTILKEDSFVRRIEEKELNIKSQTLDYSVREPVITNGIKAESKRAKRKAIFKRLSFDIGLSFVSREIDNKQIRIVANNFTYDSSILADEFISYGIYSTINYQISNHLNFKFNTIQSIVGFGFDNLNTGLDYKYNTAINTRPLKFKAGLGISYTDSYKSIASLDGPIEIGEVDLSDKITVFLEKKFISLQPSIMASIELNRRWDFFVSANFIFQLSASSSLLFEEQKGIFGKKNALLDTKGTDVQMWVDGVKSTSVPLLLNPIVTLIGFTFKY